MHARYQCCYAFFMILIGPGTLLRWGSRGGTSMRWWCHQRDLRIETNHFNLVLRSQSRGAKLRNVITFGDKTSVLLSTIKQSNLLNAWVNHSEYTFKQLKMVFPNLFNLPFHCTVILIINCTNLLPFISNCQYNFPNV